MKKLLAAVVADLMLAGASAASAQDFRYGRGDWRGRDVITIRDHGRVYTFDENDRIFYRLLESPFGMRPGNIYVYTDECRGDQCQVIIYSRYRRAAIGRLWAPPIGHPRWFGPRWRYDSRGHDGWRDRDDHYRWGRDDDDRWERDYD